MSQSPRRLGARSGTQDYDDPANRVDRRELSATVVLTPQAAATGAPGK
jgi:hypothetical protein